MLGFLKKKKVGPPPIVGATPLDGGNASSVAGGESQTSSSGGAVHLNVEPQKGGKLGVLPTYPGGALPFTTDVPPNLLTANVRKRRLKRFRPDYIFVCMMLVVSIGCWVYYGVKIKNLVIALRAVSVTEQQAEGLASQRSLLDIKLKAVREEAVNMQRLFLPVTAEFSLADVLFKLAQELPKDFYVAEFNTRWQPEFYTSTGQRLGMKQFSQANYFAGAYLVSMKVQGVGGNATAAKIEDFRHVFTPAADVSSTFGAVGDDGPSFVITYKWSPLVSFSASNVPLVQKAVGTK